jgi:hypothetical protein
MSLVYENFRVLKIEKTFDGTIGNGAEDSTTAIDVDGVYPFLDEGEYIYDVFYRITTPFNSSATIYLQFGIIGDEPTAIFNGTTGILDTLNSVATGVKLSPLYTKSAIDGRALLMVPKLGDITAGTIEITLTIARNDVSSENINYADTRTLSTPPPTL